MWAGRNSSHNTWEQINSRVAGSQTGKKWDKAGKRSRDSQFPHELLQRLLINVLHKFPHLFLLTPMSLLCVWGTHPNSLQSVCKCEYKEIWNRCFALCLAMDYYIATLNQVLIGIWQHMLIITCRCVSFGWAPIQALIPLKTPRTPNQPTSEWRPDPLTDFPFVA